jgi:hypothetical protein
MFDRDGRDGASTGGLTFAGAMLTMAVAAAIGLIWTTVDAARTQREIAQQISQERCQGSTNSDCQQLAAAVRAAVAGERAADFAAQQLWLNVLGILGLGATVVFAAFAWRAAHRSAITAENALHGSERPVLLTNSIKVGDLTRAQTPEDNGLTEVEHRMTNHGQGVAWITGHALQFEAVPTGNAVSPTKPKSEPMLWPLASGNWFGSTREVGNGIRLSLEDRAKIVAGTDDLYIWGACDYRDGGGRTYEFQFVYKYRALDGIMTPLDHPFWKHT